MNKADNIHINITDRQPKPFPDEGKCRSRIQIPEVLMSLNGKTHRQGSSEEDWKENNTAARRDRNNSLSRRAQKSAHVGA